MKLRLLLLATALGLTLTASAHAAYPSSIASTGDSITRALQRLLVPVRRLSVGFVVDRERRATRTTAASSPSTRRSPAARYNHAASGADMADLDGQVQGVIGRGAQYVTILMGANDVCASSEAADDARRASSATSSRAAMASLAAGLPNARVFVASIPDIYQLFSLYRYDLAANSVWAIAGICQSMLAYPFSNLAGRRRARARVRQRNIDYNVSSRRCAPGTRGAASTRTPSSTPPSSAATSRPATTSTRR